MSPIRRPAPKSRLSLALAAALLLPVGASAAGKLAFAPASLDFGFNALGEIKTLTATLKNGTAANIALNAATLVANPGGYKLVSTTCGATLVAGQSCKYTMKYTARTLQPAVARLELTTLDPAFPLLTLPLQANRYPALNDTGITRCGNANTNDLDCPVPDFRRQDAQFGRDKSRNVVSNGKAGFNYTKLDSLGKAQPASATAWDCVRDNVTGLVWESKLVGDGIVGNQNMHDADDSYTWYNTNAGNNGGYKGADHAGKTCFGYNKDQSRSYCNTQAFVDRVNAEGWCSFKDWRLPTRHELRSLVNLEGASPVIDMGYFPDAKPWPYWSSSPQAYSPYDAWYVSFGDGNAHNGNRYFGFAVRLVRGGQ